MPESFIDISVIGDKELQKKLKRLELKVQKKVVRKAMRAGGKIIRDLAKQKVPVKTGALKRSIKVKALRRRRGSVGVAVFTGSREQLGLAADAKFYYPAIVEFGSKHHPAHSYMRAAHDQGKPKAVATIKREIAAGILREARR